MAKCLQFQFRQQRYLLTFKPVFGFVCLFFIVLFCLLGVWQLHRYHYKQALLGVYQHRASAAPQVFARLDLKDANKKALQFQSVTLKGSYLNKLTMLEENQVHQHQVGFEVLTPIQIEGEKKLLLVDRGWIQKPTDQLIPTIQDVMGPQEITGYLKFMDEYQFILGKNILAPTMLPIVLQKIDFNDIQYVTHQEFYPFILRLNPNVTNGFVRDWTITAVIPERHLGYAIQWFVMALVLLVACIVYGVRVKQDE
jgi:surfeit locus 1 family protein